MVTFVHISNILAVTDMILTKIFGQIIFVIILFEDQNFVWTLIVWPNILLYQHCFWANFFWDKIRFCFKIFCGQWYLKNNYHNNQIKNIPNNNNYYYNYYIITILNRFQLSLKPKSIQWVVTSKQLNLVLCYFDLVKLLSQSEHFRKDALLHHSLFIGMPRARTVYVTFRKLSMIVLPSHAFS